MSKSATKTESQLRIEIETLKSNQRAIIIEQEIIAQRLVKEARDEMQIEIDKLNVNITVCYDRISRKDQEIRKLVI